MRDRNALSVSTGVHLPEINMMNTKMLRLALDPVKRIR